MQDVVRGFQSRLRAIKERGDRLFGSGGDVDASASASVPAPEGAPSEGEPQFSILPVPVPVPGERERDEGVGEGEGVAEEEMLSHLFIGRSPEEVARALVGKGVERDGKGPGGRGGEDSQDSRDSRGEVGAQLGSSESTTAIPTPTGGSEHVEL